jgi:hypothetical protein
MQYNIVEYPVAIYFIKSLIFQAVNLLHNDKEELELHHKLYLIDLLKSVIISLQVMLSDSSHTQRMCFCNIRITEENID